MSKDTSHDQLFAAYLDICNKALETNKDAFPYKQIWQATQALLKGKTIPLAIYDDHPKAIYDLSIHDNHIDISEETKSTEEDAWHVNVSYLEEVVANPEKYINNPAMIDWDWLRSRLNL